MISTLLAEEVSINYTPVALNNTYAAMLMYIVKLTFLLAIIMAGYYWWRKGLVIGGTRFEPNLKIVEKLPLDAKNSLYLLELKGKYFLLGCGERMQILETFGKDKLKLSMVERKSFDQILAAKLKGKLNDQKR